MLSSRDKSVEDYPFEKVEDFNHLKSEITEIISINKEHKHRKNANKLFNCLIKLRI